MAYNPFDDVILNDPAYMANGGPMVIPQRRNPIQRDPEEEERQRVLGELERAMAQPRPSDPTKEIRTALNPFGQPITDFETQPIQFESKTEFAPRELDFLDKAQRKFYETLTGDFTREEAFGKEILGRQLSMAQAFAEAGRELDPNRLSVSNIELQDPVLGPLLEKYGYKRGSLAEGTEATLETFFRDQRKSLEKKDRGEELDFTEKVLASKPMFFLDLLDFTGIFGLATTGALKLGARTLKYLNDAKATGKPIEEVRQTLKTQFPEDANKIGINYHTSRQTTERFTDQDLAAKQATEAEEKGMRFLKGKPPSREGTQGVITTERFEKAKPVIENLRKQNPEGLSKPQVIEALSKTFPDLNANQINSIYEGKRMVGGRIQSTFPFSNFMKKGAAAVGGEREKAASLQRITEYDDFLAKNPPEKPIAPKAAANQVKQVSFDKKGARAEKIIEYAKNNPNSAIAKSVAQPLKKAEDQITPEILTTLKSEFEVFDDFIPISTASKLTGIAENTLRRAVQKGTNGIDEFVQPQRAKGKKEAFIRSYIPGASPDQALDVQAKSLLTIDNFRGGLFGSTEQDFMKIMDEYGIIPKKIRVMGEFVDNPKYLKNNKIFEQRMANNREKFFEDQIKYLDRGNDSLKDLERMIRKRNDFGDYAKNLFKNTVRENPVLKKRFLEEYYRVLGKKFGGDEKLLDDIANYPDELFEKQLSDIARAFAGNAAHVTPISRVKGRAPKRGDQFKLSPKLRGKFSNPEFYRVNLGVDNIGRQPRFENIIVDNIKKINKIKSFPRTERFNILDKSIDRIAEINQEMINNNMATFLEFSKKDLSSETMKKLIQEGTISKNAFEESDNKIILFLGKQKDMSLQELKDMFNKRLSKYILAPELFKLSKQRPKGAKIEDEMFIKGSAPYIVKGFPLDFKKGGAVRMAIGGDPLENINQQQFEPDPAFEGKDFFQEAVDSGNLTAFNPLKLFKTFGKVDAVETPKKKIQTDTQQGPPGTTLPATQEMQPSDFALKSFTLETIMDPNAPKAARPQDWQNFFKGKAAPEAELRDSGILQYLGDFNKYFPNQKITQQQLVDFYETSPMGNISIKVKQDGTNVPADPAFLNFSGRPRHKNTGQQPLDEVGRDYREVVVQAGPLPGEGKPFVASGHFQEENVIGFTRVATYDNASGQPVAVIQELQTDMLTKVRKEQERLNALLKRIENVKAKLQERISGTDEYYRAMGQRKLDEINQAFPPATLQKLQENLSAIKPFPNTAGAELIPGYAKELSDLQKEINKLAEIDIANPNPQTIFGIDAIETKQQKVLDNILDLTRDTELERDLKGIQVPSTRESDELVAFGESADDMNLQYGGFKDLELFPPIPFNKQPDYVDLLIKATIKDAQTKGINKVAIMPAEKVNRRWGKNPDGPEGKKFKNLYDQVAVQQLKNIAKKYKGNVAIEQIIDSSKPNKGFRFLNKKVDGELELLKEDVARPAGDPRALTEADINEFYNEQIRRFVSDEGYRQKDVVLSREIAPGQYQDFYVYADDDKVDFLPLEEGESIKDALIVIEEFNPQKIDMVTLTLDSPQSKEPFFMFKKKDGGTIAKDSLLSVTDIFGQYGR